MFLIGKLILRKTRCTSATNGRVSPHETNRMRLNHARRPYRTSRGFRDQRCPDVSGELKSTVQAWLVDTLSRQDLAMMMTRYFEQYRPPGYDLFKRGAFRLLVAGNQNVFEEINPYNWQYINKKGLEVEMSMLIETLKYGTDCLKCESLADCLRGQSKHFKWRVLSRKRNCRERLILAVAKTPPACWNLRWSPTMTASIQVNQEPRCEINAGPLYNHDLIIAERLKTDKSRRWIHLKWIKASVASQLWCVSDPAMYQCHQVAHFPI